MVVGGGPPGFGWATTHRTRAPTATSDTTGRVRPPSSSSGRRTPAATPPTPRQRPTTESSARILHRTESAPAEEQEATDPFLSPSDQAVAPVQPDHARGCSKVRQPR